MKILRRIFLYLSSMLLVCCGDGSTPQFPHLISLSNVSSNNTSWTVSTIVGPSSSNIDGAGTSAVFNGPQDITSDGINLYVSDSQFHAIRKINISTGNVSTIAGVIGTTGAIDGKGTNASFFNPQGITTDGKNLYIADRDNHQIRKIEISSGIVSTLAGSSGSPGYIDGVGTNARFNYPQGITIVGANLYVTDCFNNRIRKIDLSTGVVSSFAGGTSTNSSLIDGVGAAAMFLKPSGISNDGTYLYVADTNNNVIRRIEIATANVTTLAGVGPNNAGMVDGIGRSAKFFTPTGITTDGIYLYISDIGSDTIRRLDTRTNGVNTIAGRYIQFNEYNIDVTNGIGTLATFAKPAGMFTDSTYLYIADSRSDKIRKMTIASGEVATLVGSDARRHSKDGIGNDARVYSPWGVVIVGTYIFVADSGSKTIRKIDLNTRAVTTIAGKAGVSGSTDGIGSAATFRYPVGITSDGIYLYVTDNGLGGTIRKINITTQEVTTFAGAFDKPGFIDAKGSSARFRLLYGITTDGKYLYVADSNNYVIRKIAIGTADVTTIAGIAGISAIKDGIGNNASFANPMDIVAIGSCLYVADQRTIRQMNISTGNVTTFAGNLLSNQPIDGRGTKASFGGITGIASDGNSLYVSDTYVGLIRKVDVSTGDVVTLAGKSMNFGVSDGKDESARFYYPRGLALQGRNIYVADGNNNTIRKVSPWPSGCAACH